MPIDKIIIRKLRQNDWKNVCKLIDNIFNSSDELIAKKEITFDLRTRKYKIEDGSHFWVAEDNGKLIGITGLTETPEKISWMSWFGLKKKYRGQGIGKKLLQFTIKKARQRGAKKLCVQCGTLPMFKKANNIYKEFGFTEKFKIKNYWQKRDNLVVMSLNL